MSATTGPMAVTAHRPTDTPILKTVRSRADRRLMDESASPRDHEPAGIDAHGGRAVVFWVACSVSVAMFLTAAPSDAAVASGGGFMFAVSYLALTVVCGIRLAIGPRKGPIERFTAASTVTIGLGVQQYLAGDVPMLFVLLPFFVLGAIAGVDRTQRLTYLPIAIGTALSPLLYQAIDTGTVAVHFTFALVVTTQMTLLGDFGDRLRLQRHELAQAEAESAHRSLTDELTGLGNRRALNERISPLLPAGSCATVIYCDLDGFKPFNDRFGHAAGDALLRRLGVSLAEAARPNGVAFRVGGDEFCVVLDGQVPPGDPRIAVVTAALVEDGPGYEVECSFGVASTPDDALDLGGALQVADQRMYLHKRARRSERIATWHRPAHGNHHSV